MVKSQSPASLNLSLIEDCQYRDDWCNVITHIYVLLQFRFKDFASEVRGNMDIEALLDDAAVLLDLTETSLERIIHTILTKTLDILDAPLAYEEAMTTLFLPESGNILAKTIQVFSLLKLVT